MRVGIRVRVRFSVRILGIRLETGSGSGFELGAVSGFWVWDLGFTVRGWKCHHTMCENQPFKNSLTKSLLE